jgi:hypothetical protein
VDESGIMEIRCGSTIGQKMTAMLVTPCTTPRSNSNPYMEENMTKLFSIDTYTKVWCVQQLTVDGPERLLYSVQLKFYFIFVKNSTK